MNPLIVQVPCRRFKVVVKLGPANGIGHIESLLLRRLGLGPATLQEVAALFSLPESLVLDRVVTLFRRGLVALHPGEQKLDLGEAVRSAMGDPASPDPDWQKKLGLGGNLSKEVELYREMVSGAVFPRPRGDITRWEYKLPPSLELSPVDEIPKPVLLSAASSRLREERTGMKNLRVFDVACAGGPDASSASPTTEAYGTIVVEVLGFNLDGDNPMFSVVGPSSVGRRVRDAIADGISNLYQRGLVGPLVDALCARAREGAAEAITIVHDPAIAAKMLTDLVNSVPVDATEGVLEERHESAITLAREIDDAVNSAAAYEGRAELLIGSSAHRQMLLEALRQDAQAQVIVAAPRISGLARDQEMQEALMEAVSRGVRVHMLWGTPQVNPTEELAPLHSLIELLRPKEQSVGGLFISDHPVNLGASAVACDLRRVLVGGFDWFSSNRWDSQAIAFVLPSIVSENERDSRSQVPTVVVEVVQALRQACPDAALRRVIMADTVLDGGRAILQERSPLEYPNPPTAGLAISVQIWKNEWSRWLRDLDSIQNINARTARLIPRGGHRRELVRALEQATRRLILVSTRLGDGALGAAIEPYIMGALNRGVELTFFYRDILPRQDLLDRLRRYQSRGLRLAQGDILGSFVISDSRALVGSFQFGSSDGERGALALGFDVRDVEFTERLIKLVIHSEVTSSPSPHTSTEVEPLELV